MHGEQQTMVSRRGRLRKNAARKPSGRLVQNELENRGGPVAARRMMDRLLTGATDPAMGTVIGRLFLHREITAAGYNAACKFAVLRARADRALGLPARNPKALQYEAARGLSCILDDPEAEIETLAAYDAAEIAIGLHSRQLAAVQDIVIYDELPDDYAQKLDLIAGIEKLVGHWRLVA